MGEAEFKQYPLAKAVSEALLEQGNEVQRITTPGGKFQVRWDEGGSATALGQLAFFAEFLEVSGLFERWVDGCPMSPGRADEPKALSAEWEKRSYFHDMTKHAADSFA